MKFKYKVEIVIDEEKVINDDIYDPKEMYEYIKNMFRRFDLPEIKTDKPYHLIFTDKGRSRDYGALGRTIFDLYEYEWFKKYAVKFKFYDLISGSCEDIIYKINKYRSHYGISWKKLLKGN